jgi:hypothetical protein
MRRGGRIALVTAALAFVLTGCSTAGGRTPLCPNTDDSVFILLAQSVPSATELPCVSEFPAGWTFGGSEISRGLSRFWLDSDRGGIHAVEVSLLPTCDTEGADEQQPAANEAGTRVFFRVDSLEPSFRGTRFLLFDGGCISYAFRFTNGASSTLAIEAIDSLSVLSRATIVDEVRKDPGLILCGAGAPPCAG